MLEVDLIKPMVKGPGSAPILHRLGRGCPVGSKNKAKRQNEWEQGCG
jgi:hypothetical protein